MDADTRSDMITWTPTPRRGKDTRMSCPTEDCEELGVYLGFAM